MTTPHLLSRMSHYSIAHHGGHMESSSLDPVTYADWQGGLADLRIAGNVASGVPLDLIDPSAGTTADPGGWTAPWPWLGGGQQ